MAKTTKFLLILTIICLTITISSSVNAQENQTDQTPNLISTQDSQNEAAQDVALDEAVSSQDLEIKDQNLLPDSPFYFLKNWLRKARVAITIDKVKKAELEQKYTNEKLIELKKLAEKNASAEIIEKATENYQKAVELVKERVEKIKEKAEENQNVSNFLDKFTKQQVLQEKILEKLEGQVPSNVIEKIKEARENHLERFKEVMLKLENNKERIAERLKNAIESQEGSEFKDFKNLEILNRIKEKMPEEVKEQIQEKAEGKILENLKTKIEALPVGKQEVLKNYIDKISGNKEKQLEILENIRAEIKEENTTIKEKIQEIKNKIIEKIPEQINAEKIDCPKIEKPADNFCEKGRIIIKKDEKGCPLFFDCVTPAETIKEKAACITLWNPVCGKNGRTYSNECFIKAAGVEIAYKGDCKEKECKTAIDCLTMLNMCGSPEGLNYQSCIEKQTRNYKCLEGKCIISECQIDADCPLLKCPSTTNSAVKCLEMKNKCVNGKCVEVSLKVEAE